MDKYYLLITMLIFRGMMKFKSFNWYYTKLAAKLPMGT